MKLEREEKLPDYNSLFYQRIGASTLEVGNEHSHQMERSFWEIDEKENASDL